MDVSLLPHVNASLNAIATVLLITGVGFIRRGRELAHKRTMLACFGVSVLFLISYLVYHIQEGSKHFPDYPPPAIRTFYFGMLASHVVLAAAVPFLAVITIVLGLRDQRARHRFWAKVTFPIWLYVSITGVLVYLMLYQIYPPLPSDTKMKASATASTARRWLPIELEWVNPSPSEIEEHDKAFQLQLVT